MTHTVPAPAAAIEPVRVLAVPDAAWRPLNDWANAVGIEIVEVPSGPSQAPRFGMTPRSLHNLDQRATDPVAAAGLTARELQVLLGMSRGQSNGTIGRELFLSEDTVKTHARRLFRKLKVGDRAEAVAAGFRRGILS